MLNAYPLLDFIPLAIGAAGATAGIFLTPLVATTALGVIGFSAAGPVAGQLFHPSCPPCTHTVYRLYCCWPSGWNWKRRSWQPFCGCTECGYGWGGRWRRYSCRYSRWRCRRCRCRGRGPLSSTYSCPVLYNIPL
jgi:hypothetical protein